MQRSRVGWRLGMGDWLLVIGYRRLVIGYWSSFGAIALLPHRLIAPLSACLRTR